MKNPVTVLLLSVFCLLNHVEGQSVPKGVWLTGGNAGFSIKDNKGFTTTRTIQLQPNAGYFFIDDLGVGVEIAYSRTSSNSSSLSILGVGPWIRYYVTDNIFGHASVNFGKYFIKFDGQKATTSFNGMEMGLGYSKWISSAVALEPVVFFNLQTAQDESDDNITNFSYGLNLGLQIFIGRD